MKYECLSFLFDGLHFFCSIDRQENSRVCEHGNRDDIMSFSFPPIRSRLFLSGTPVGNGRTFLPYELGKKKPKCVRMPKKKEKKGKNEREREKKSEY
jgi:hypothetical protein